MDVEGYKCLCCGAPLLWDATEQIMKCTSCDNKYSLDTLDQAKRADEAAATQADHFNWEDYHVDNQITEAVAYTCPSCGADIIVDGTVAADRCPYCDNVAIMQPQVTGMIKPDCIIPFKLTKDEAKAQLLRFYEGKKLLPDRFTSQNHMDEITGVYVPFWLFDCEADISAQYDATKTSGWTSAGYNVTKVDHYLISRQGNLMFEKVPVDSSVKMDDAYMDAIEPYDYSALVPFEQAYLSGYVANKPDVEVKDCFGRANDRISNSAEEALRASVSGYGSITTKSKSISTGRSQIRYALLPVWLLTTKYEGKVYTFAMNGQTGKMVGELPVDQKKYKRRKWLLTGIILAIGVLITACVGGWL